MTVTIRPSVCRGKVTVPASKSELHRLLICAAMCRHPVTVTNVTCSEDIKATISCLLRER